MDLVPTKAFRAFFLATFFLGPANAVFESCSPWLTPEETLTLNDTMTTLELQTDAVTWWEASQRGCSRGNNSREGAISLFWRSGDEFSALTAHLVMGTFQLWTGGLAVNTPWTWTDGRPLYQYLGTGNVSGGGLTDYSAHPENDAFRCHFNCSSFPGLSMLALQGDQCSCADNASLTTPTDPSFHCTGTYLESCGTRDSASLYSIDMPAGMTWSVSREGLLVEGLCAYVIVTVANGGVSLIPASDCNRTQMFVCQFESPPENSSCQMFCASNESATWTEALAYCRSMGGSLAVPNNTNMAEFQAVLTLRTRYWIGLSRTVELRTIDGTVEQAVSQRDLNQGRLCQVLNFDVSGMPMSSLQPCNTLIRPLYIKATPGVTRMPFTTMPTTTMPTTTMPTTTMATTTMATTTKPSTMPSTVMPTTMSMATDTARPRQETTSVPTVTSTQRQQPSNQTAVIAGTAIAVLLILAIAFFVLAYMKKEGKLCFQPLQPGKEQLQRDFDPEDNNHQGANGTPGTPTTPAMAETGFSLEHEAGVDLDSPVGPGPVIPEIHVTTATAAPAAQPASGEATSPAQPASGEATATADSSTPADVPGESTGVASSPAQPGDASSGGPASSPSSSGGPAGNAGPVTGDAPEPGAKQGEAGDEATKRRPSSSSSSSSSSSDGSDAKDEPASDEQAGKSSAEGGGENSKEPAGGDSGGKGGEESGKEASEENGEGKDDASAPEASTADGSEKAEGGGGNEVLKTEL